MVEMAHAVHAPASIDGRVAHVAFDDLAVDALEVRARAGGARQRPHVSTPSRQRAQHRRADEAGGAGDQDAVAGRGAH